MSNVVKALDALVQQLKALATTPDPVKAAELAKWIDTYYDDLKSLLLDHLLPPVAAPKDTDLITIEVDLDGIISTFLVYYGNTVGQLKEAIELKMGILRAEQDLRQHGVSVSDINKAGALSANVDGIYRVNLFATPGAKWKDNLMTYNY